MTEGKKQSSSGELVIPVPMDPEGPLSGRSVIVTRNETPDGPLTTRLRSAGARVLNWPVIEIRPPHDPKPLHDALSQLDEYDWIFFTSSHAVDAVRRQVEHPPANLSVAAVGNTTARSLNAIDWPVHFQPVEFRAAALVEELDRRFELGGKRVLYPASSIARDTIPKALERLGSKLDQVIAYENHEIPLDLERCIEQLNNEGSYVITFTSPSAVFAFARELGPSLCDEILGRIPSVVIGPTTAQALEETCGIRSFVAGKSTLDGIVTTVGRAQHLRS